MNVYRCLFSIAATVAVLTLSVPVDSHSTDHENIHLLTEQIAVEPENAQLYLQRGEYHRIFRHWDAALADYKKTEELAPGAFELDLYRARLWMDAERPKLAKPLLDHFLKEYPNHANALLARSRLSALQGEPLSAAKDLDRVISSVASPSPQLFVERARLLVKAGPQFIAKGLDSLDQGIERHGPLVSLLVYAIELEVERYNPEGALARWSQLPDVVKDQPQWLARRGDLLQLAGKIEAGRQSYRDALDAIERLPLSRRQVPAIVKLELHLKRLLS